MVEPAQLAQALMHRVAIQVCNADLATSAAVGILAAQCAHIRGAQRIIMIDNQQYRLDFAKQKLPYLELLNFDNTKDVVQSLKDMIPHGPDVCIEAVGFHYATSIKDKIQMALMMETDPALMLNQMIMACKKRGRLSIVSSFPEQSSRLLVLQSTCAACHDMACNSAGCGLHAFTSQTSSCTLHPSVVTFKLSECYCRLVCTLLL